MGAGFKAGVNIWQALRDIDSVHPAWAHRCAERAAARGWVLAAAALWPEGG